jgi:hypothetical protein
VPLQRFSSRRERLYDAFLKPRLPGVDRYDRIAGYFQSSLLDVAADELQQVRQVRIVCNTDVSAEDVQTVRMATGSRRKELEAELLRLIWNQAGFPRLVDVHGHPAQERFQTLYQLITASRNGERVFEIRVVPDSEFGFVHGKGGVLHYSDGRKTSFVGSANDSKSAWSLQYELVWEDDSPESGAWMQAEFDALWARGFPLSDYIVKQIRRLGQRTILERVGQWREDPEPGKVLAETPTVTELFGFWDHQKYFINLAFKEHLSYAGDPLRGARYLLADGVGLGKTLQLGAIAKLIGTLDEKNLPILIVAPKPLLPQWQDELMAKLLVPSAYWNNEGWVTERDEFHPALPSTTLTCPRKVGLVATSAVVSAGRSPQNQRLTEELLTCRFSCVIWDEAHKVRRKNLQEPKVYQAPEKNSLYAWAEKLAARAQTLILATATPVQLHPMELWDLLHVLSVNNPQVLGNQNSRWRDARGPRLFDILAGREAVKTRYDKWDFWRDPLPQETDANTAVFRHIRQTLGLTDGDASACLADLDRLDPVDLQDLDLLDVREINPFTTRVIKRSRDRLEAEGKLVPIEMVAVKDAPILCTHSMAEALDLAERFAKALHRRIPASGFIKTLLQRRVSSSLKAGLITTRRMLSREDLAGDENPEEEEGELYPLRPEEMDLLKLLEAHLTHQLDREGDPKFERVLEILQSDFEALVPRAGLQAIPDQLAQRLPPDALRLETEVTAVALEQDKASAVRLASGEEIPLDQLVLACPEPVTAKLIGAQVREAHPAAVVYFRAEHSIYPEKLLVLQTGRTKLVRNLVQITNISPDYAPPGVHLISATVLRAHVNPSDAAAAEQEINRIFKLTPGTLRHVRTVEIPYAVPVQPPGSSFTQKFAKPFPNVWRCGDQISHASFQGAMDSGAVTARTILQGG